MKDTFCSWQSSSAVTGATVILGLILLAAAPVAAADAPAGVTHALPTGGRTYEILMPPVQPSEMKDMPLVLFLHPAGRPMLEEVRRDWWPLFRDRKCLLALPRAKSDKLWAAGEDNYLADVLADIQTRYSVDAERILLAGVSGGGQVALFLADHAPAKFRAVIAVSTSPVVVRGDKSEWFYPAREALKTCPYFVVNPLPEGSALMYWRQVRAKLEPAGASITIWPVVVPGPGSGSGAASRPATTTSAPAVEYVPPPAELGPWLDDVLKGAAAPLPDPQATAVAKMFAPAVAALVKQLGQPVPVPDLDPARAVAKDGGGWSLSAFLPAEFERPKAEDTADSSGAALAQIRLEHAKWPIFIRCEARTTAKPVAEVLAAEEQATLQRGVLYQAYHSGTMTLRGRAWQVKVGSITYPDRRRGWVSALFAHAAAPVAKDPTRWLTVMVTDETQAPDGGLLASLLQTVAGTISAAPAPPGPPAATTSAPKAR